MVNAVHVDQVVVLGMLRGVVRDVIPGRLEPSNLVKHHPFLTAAAVPELVRDDDSQGDLQLPWLGDNALASPMNNVDGDNPTSPSTNGPEGLAAPYR